MRVSATSSRHTGTTRCLAARVWNPARPRPVGVGAGRRGHRSGGRVAEGPVEAGAVAGVAGAGPLLVDDHQQHVAVAVVAHGSGRTAGRRRSRPCTRTPVGCGSRTRSVRSPGSWRNDSRFIQAIISTARVRGVLDDGRDQPVGVEGDHVQFVVAEVDGDGGNGRVPAGAGGVVGCPGGAHERCSLMDWFGAATASVGGCRSPPVVRSDGVTVTGTGRSRRRYGWRPRRGCPARAGSRTRPPGPRPRSGPRD